MGAGANSDLYAFLPPSILIEEGPQSSEDGSGLHSPIFSAHFLPGDVRCVVDQYDIHNAAAILGSQFDYNALPPNVKISQADSLWDAPMDVLPGDEHGVMPRTYSDYYRSQDDLVSDFSVGYPVHARLPPPPAINGPSDQFFDSSGDRYPVPLSCDHPGGASPVVSAQGMRVDSDKHCSPTSTIPGIDDSFTDQSPEPAREPRKESSMVVIACRQCRARKIRCDSTRPVCQNCIRRQNPCEYDAVPKRRGPDKRPGTRQRSCKKRPADDASPSSKRKRTDNPIPDDQFRDGIKENAADVVAMPGSSSRPSNGSFEFQTTARPPRRYGSTGSMDLYENKQSFFKDDASSKDIRGSSRRGLVYDSDSLEKSFARRLDVNGHDRRREATSEKHCSISPTPSSEYGRKSWWDNLVDTYSSSREQSISDISADLSDLFATTNYWLSFVNVPVFLRALSSADERTRIQPSLIYAGLAMSTLMKASELELGAGGRSRALWLRDIAQAELEKSWNTQFIDTTLAEAALILALFESSAHPRYNTERYAASLGFVDTIVKALNLTALDIDKPHVSVFPKRSVPVVSARPRSPKESISSSSVSKRCSCIVLPRSAPLTPAHFSSSWSYTPPWDPDWSPSEVRKEECRRLCWSTLNLISSHISYCAVFDRDIPDFYLSESSNYAIYFPGEVLESAKGVSQSLHSTKETVWALYCRSMLLWNFCVRLREDPTDSQSKAELALTSWMETQVIQDALDIHICNLDTALLYMCREYLYNTRMVITQVLRRLVPPSNTLHGLDSGSTMAPVFNRKQAEEWLYYQEQVVKRIKSSAHKVNVTKGHLLTRRPFQVNWFSSQLAICLKLWNRDRSLLNALNLGKSIVVPLDILNELWPCPVQAAECDDLRESLNDACAAAGLPLVSAKQTNIPSILKSG